MSLLGVRGNARFDQRIPPRRCKPDLDALNRRDRVRLVRDIVLGVLVMAGLALAYWRLSHG